MKTFLSLLVSGLPQPLLVSGWPQPTPLESKPLCLRCNWAWFAFQSFAHSRKQGGCAEHHFYVLSHRQRKKTNCKHILDRCPYHVKRVLGLFACMCRPCQPVIKSRSAMPWQRSVLQIFKPESSSNNELTTTNMFEKLRIQNHSRFVMVLQKKNATIWKLLVWTVSACGDNS